MNEIELPHHVKIIDTNRGKVITIDVATYIPTNQPITQELINRTLTSHCIHVKSLVDKHIQDADLSKGHSWWKPKLTSSYWWKLVLKIKAMT